MWPTFVGARGADGVLLALGAAGWLLLAVALGAHLPSLVAAGLVILGAGYAVSLGADIDGRAPLYAGLLLLVGELAYWALDLRVPMAAEPGTLRRRAFAAGVTPVLGVVLAAVILALTAVPALAGSVAWEVVGVLAAAGALTLVVLLARPRRS